MIPATAKPIRALILTMTALVVISLIYASLHYRKENRSVDPRVAVARKLYEGYNNLAAQNDFAKVIGLLDSIEGIYHQYPHYYNSFETGVLENNRAAVYLTIVLSYDSISSPFHHLGPDSLMGLGEAAVRNSIYIYERWMAGYSDKNDKEISDYIKESFIEGLIDNDPDTNIPSGEIERYLDNRVEEIRVAIKETPRRLSVSYTNLGIVYRYREDYHSAAACYQKALELWEDNLSAENNLNILLGRPIRERNFIQKMFPKPKN
jgi:tetratricopeptide (TPR) repeat protein